MTLCVRVKTHTLISGSLIYWCVRNIGRFFRWVLRGAGTALGYLPLLWRVLACYGALCVAEFLAIMMFVNWYSSGFLFLWFLEKLVLGALVGYVTLAFRRLKLVQNPSLPETTAPRWMKHIFCWTSKPLRIP